MARFFLEIAYDGTAYHGLATQAKGNTIQKSIEDVLGILYKTNISTTTSSRTDAGVHARQNYIHFDAEMLPDQLVFKLNAILPSDIYIISCKQSSADAHCRFDAKSRLYKYHLTLHKDPFLINKAWHYPYKVDMDILHKTAEIIYDQTDFTSFCKKHSDNFTNNCQIIRSHWTKKSDTHLVYTVEANRFLRGMVRGLVATQLAAARGKMDSIAFQNIFAALDSRNAFFDAPAHGLFLEKVQFG